MDPLIMRLLASANRVTSLALHASVAVDSPQITIPASVLPGDVGVLCDAASDVYNGMFDPPLTIPTAVLPSGWTQISNQSISDGSLAAIRSLLSYRILQSSDAGATLTGMDTTAYGGASRKVLLVFRPDRPAGVVSIGSLASEGTAGNPASQTVTASGGAAPLAVIAVYRSSGASLSSQSFSPAQDAEITQGTTMAVRYKLYNASPADVTVDLPDLAVQTLQSFYVQVS